MNQYSGVKILGTGRFLPDFTVTNADFSEYMDTDDEWITSRTGIKQRQFAVGISNLDMAAAAAKLALESAGTSPEEIGMIIATTATPDYFYPTLSCLVQRAVGAKNSAAIDVWSACTGFVNALDVARNYFCGGFAKKILIVSSEMLSRHADFRDRASCVLFGDGAGAVVLAPSDSLYSGVVGAVGEDFAAPVLYCKVGYSPNSPFLPSESGKESGYLTMDGKEVYRFATDIMPRAIREACGKAEIPPDSLDLIIPHQANSRIIATAMKNLGLPPEKVYVNIDRTANISSACIPACLDELRIAGRLKPGMRLCMVAFGAGLTYGAVVMEV